MYRVIATDIDRRFEITGGLREGYDAGSREHTLDDIVLAHQMWQVLNRTILGVMITPAAVSYGWPEGDTVRVDSEPGFILSGSVSVIYAKDDTDAMVRDRILSLASYLAKCLNQHRLYVSVLGQSSVIERQS